MGWEGFIIETILNTLSQKGIPVNPYYFRSSDGYELDLVLDFGIKELWGIEIKLSSNIKGADVEHVKNVSKMIKVGKRFLICQINKGMFDGKFGFGNIMEFIKIIEKEV